MRTAIELAGFAIVLAAVAWLYWPAALALFGLGLVLYSQVERFGG